MNTWQNLKSTALLGTDKMPFEAKILPESLQKVLEKAPKNDPEGYFLKAAALSYTYQKAGQSPARATLPEINKISEETQTVCPPQAVEVWRNILDEEYFNPYLFEYLTDVCIQKNWIIPQNLIVNILNKTSKKNLPNVYQILGERGKWLAQFNNKWQYYQPTSLDTAWLEGKNAERFEVLKQIRTDNPERSLEMLKSVWESESGRDRRLFLEVFEFNRNKNDEDFIYAVYKDILQQKDNDKGIKAEIKSKCVELLLSIENSELSISIWEQKVKHYFQIKEKKLFGIFKSERAVIFSPPANFNFLLDVNLMEKQLGLPKRENDYVHNDTTYWVNYLMGFINPNKWISFFGCKDAEECINIFLNNEGFFVIERQYKLGIKEFLFINNLFEASKRFNEDTFINAFFRLFDIVPQEIKLKLLDINNPAQYEDVIMKYVPNEILISNIDTIIKNSPKSSWSITFAEYLISETLKDVVKNTRYYNIESLIFKIVPLLNNSINISFIEESIHKVGLFLNDKTLNFLRIKKQIQAL
jgi:Family of unknown function (DUF5691)